VGAHESGAIPVLERVTTLLAVDRRLVTAGVPDHQSIYWRFCILMLQKRRGLINENMRINQDIRRVFFVPEIGYGGGLISIVQSCMFMSG
jgi:hypothetical protein